MARRADSLNRVGMRVLIAALAFSLASFVLGVAGDLSERAQAAPVAAAAYAAVPPAAAAPVLAVAPSAVAPLPHRRVAQLAPPPGGPPAVKISGKAPASPLK